MTDDTTSRLAAIFTTVLQTEASAFDLNKPRTAFPEWDSLNHMQIISEIENAFGVRFEMDEVVEINRPKDLADLIAKKKATA